MLVGPKLFTSIICTATNLGTLNRYHYDTIYVMECIMRQAILGVTLPRPNNVWA